MAQQARQLLQSPDRDANLWLKGDLQDGRTFSTPIEVVGVVDRHVHSYHVSIWRFWLDHERANRFPGETSVPPI